MSFMIYDLLFTIYDFAGASSSPLHNHQLSFIDGKLWSSAWPAGLIMLGLGLGFAIVLLIASERLKVATDPQDVFV